MEASVKHSRTEEQDQGMGVLVLALPFSPHVFPNKSLSIL